MASIDGNAGHQAIQEFDANSDGSLDGAELGKAPGLKAALARVDSNHDGKLTVEEIDARIDQWRALQVALMPVTFTITLDQQRLAGAEVRLVPEKFLGAGIKAAAGTTSNSGAAGLWISDHPDERGVGPGFYRVEITKKEGGKETIPAKFNAQTELGVEMAGDNLDRDFVLNLSSR
ncbi:MAG: hypothetical protein IT427_18445 [Pirellulales bacterium]|nr:hypothetical protein [Pirellulales bacterium]